LKIEYHKKFLKDLAKIPSPVRGEIEKFMFERLPKLKTIFESGKVEKMTGYSSYYKIRFGSYRIGIKIENDVVILERVLHRKDIYRYFP